MDEDLVPSDHDFLAWGYLAMSGESSAHSRFCSCGDCMTDKTPVSPSLDRDTILAYARHIYDRSGWKTTRYGDPTVRILILPDRLLPINRSLAEIDSALTAYAARLSALTVPLDLLGGPAAAAYHPSGAIFSPSQRAAIHKLTYPLRFMAAETPTHG